MIVIDASAAVSGLVDATSAARAYLVRNDLQVPHLIDQEVLSALRRLALTGDLPDVDADTYVARWTQLRMRRHDTSGLIDEIWGLRHNVTPYDATYIALATSLQTSLVTADRRLHAAPISGIEVTLV